MRDELAALVAEREPRGLVFIGATAGCSVRRRSARMASTRPRRPGALRDGEPPRPHDLRHTAASLMENAGSSIVEVSRYLGHESISTTANLCMHLLPDARSEKHERMDRLMRESEAAASAGANYDSLITCR